MSNRSGTSQTPRDSPIHAPFHVPCGFQRHYPVNRQHTTAHILTQVWADVFAKALAGKDLKEILFNIGASGPAAAAPAAAAAGSSDAPAAEEAEEEKDESDDDMGFGLFD